MNGRGRPHLAGATGAGHRADLAGRCRGLLAGRLATAEAAFAVATAAHRSRRTPFERARALLCEGETLRRLRRPADARAQLLAAHAAPHLSRIYRKLGIRCRTGLTRIVSAARAER